ncbi:MAG: DUF1638 domain-containing protein [Candidatus Hydrogenedentes bacterium]|nr:DUF1638 domain-containing protein [Candidatus Hydrogenedentota bacterium]
MHFRILACNVLTREICWCAAKSPNTLDVSFFPKDKHNHPSTLRELLQQEIDSAATGDTFYDAILLAYGLCGNATVGLRARRFPLIIPRAHDCTTLFLGSKTAFADYFGETPSQSWTSVGYSERSDSILSDGNTQSFTPSGQSFFELAEIYGEENARDLWDTLTAHQENSEVPFLDVPETHISSKVKHIKSCIESTGKKMRTIPGNICLIESLISGNWSEENFLTVLPEERITGVYDHEQVIRSEKTP